MHLHQLIRTRSTLTFAVAAAGLAASALVFWNASVARAAESGADPAQRRSGADAAAAQQTSARLDSALRFQNSTIVSSLRDPHLLPRPASRPFMREAYFFDAYIGQRSVRNLKGDVAVRARNVNALDEVPDSSWFQNRIGTRPIPPSELQVGALAAPAPPFSVVGIKEGGVSPGMRVLDAKGVGYVLKFDRPDDPDSETGADLVLQRLLWAVGYHTPEDKIVYFRREDLRLAPRASLKDPRGVTRPMTTADLTRVFRRVGRRPDGSYRGLMSRLLDGVPVGGYPQEGVRPDDPNDVVPHEDRRELRGARVFFSWLNHVDIKEDNCLDTWVEEPGTPGLGRLRHHLVDFGNSMGVFAWQTDTSAGFSQAWDLAHGGRSLVSFGLWKRPWEGLEPSALRGVGNLESARFDPAAWRSLYPWAPFERFDRFDGSWAARILMRLSPEQVAAAVAAGGYEDPRAAAYITRTLVERQRKIGRHYLAETSPLEGFSLSAQKDGARICFEDPLLAHFGAQEPQLASTTRHHIVTWDFDGRPLPKPQRTERAGAAQVCIDALVLAPDHDGYTIVDIETTRAGTPRQRLLAHIARDPRTGRPQVIGLRRM